MLPTKHIMMCLCWLYCLWQVHPAKLTHALMSAAQEAAGAQLVIGTVTGISTVAGAVTGVKVQQQQQGAGSSEVEVAADVVVLAMGPWTDAARQWLPAAPEMSGEGHSN
jgi:glycerol-3-phosphate dehydrogenase